METQFEPTPLAEIVHLAALDPDFHNRHFFPKTCRQESPEFHKEIYALMEDPSNRYVAIKVFRDGAKTTVTRLYLAKRIGFGISRTILVVGKSQEAAMKTVDWVRRQVEHNAQWAQTFGLRPGNPWTATEAEIISDVEDFRVRIMAIGITGSTRGINIDDYRPDLILVDDPCDEENTATPEQRQKVEERFFGALYSSLAPRSDMPEAKMILLQTPLDGEDLIEQCMKDPAWASAEFSVFDENGESRWPQRYPTAEVLQEKQNFINRNQLHIWLREKEVTVVSSESAYFRAEWIKYWELLPEGGVNIIAIDPTPPPKETSVAKRTAKLDDFVIMVLKFYKRKIYVVEMYQAKSPLPEEWLAKFFEFVDRYRPLRVRVETVLFQRMVRLDLERAMNEKKRWIEIRSFEGDKRKKETRITNELNGPLSNGVIYVHHSHSDLIEQITKYPFVAHDDCIDALSIGVQERGPAMDYLSEQDDYLDGEWEELPDDNWRGAP